MSGLLALDVATRTGWAFWRPGEKIESGVLRLPPASRGLGRSLCKYDAWLSSRLYHFTPDLVVFQAPILPKNSQIQTLRTLYSLAGLTELLCDRHNIECREAKNSEVLKHFTGSAGGKREARKERVIAACEVRGWKPEDDNEADALAILDYSAQARGMPVEWPRSSLEAMSYKGPRETRVLQ